MRPAARTPRLTGRRAPPYDAAVSESPTIVGSLEYAVMAVLWELGTATPREVHDRIGAPAGLAYTTIGTVLERLLAKGCCERERTGKTFAYRPRIAREVIDRSRAKDTITKLIGGDPVPAIACLVEAIESLDPALLGELARATEARRNALGAAPAPAVTEALATTAPEDRHGS